MTSPLSLAFGIPAKAMEFPKFKVKSEHDSQKHEFRRKKTLVLLIFERLTWSVVSWGFQVFVKILVGPLALTSESATKKNFSKPI